VPCYAGEVLSQSREREPRARLVSMALACRHLKTFLRRCQLYGLLPKNVAEAVEQLASCEQSDPRNARTQKVEQRQQILALSKKLKDLQQAREYRRHADDESGANRHVGLGSGWHIKRGSDC
jgi:TAP42-like family